MIFGEPSWFCSSLAKSAGEMVCVWLHGSLSAALTSPLNRKRGVKRQATNNMKRNRKRAVLERFLMTKIIKAIEKRRNERPNRGESGQFILCYPRAASEVLLQTCAKSPERFCS